MTEPSPRDIARTDKRRQALAQLLVLGGQVALGTPESRQAWNDGIPELVAAIERHFTPEELAIILDGTR